MIDVAVVGSAGYVGGELIRLLLDHPQVANIYAQSDSQAGKPVSSTHGDLFAHDLLFREDHPADVNVIFVSKGHGWSSDNITSLPGYNSALVIDMGNDFRIAADGNPFVYGLPEWQRRSISSADQIANPGCFATAIQLAIYPLLESKLITGEIHIHGITGSTGAGASMLDTTHFSWRNNNTSLYKAFTHQHMGEVMQLVKALDPHYREEINFVPLRGNFTRGILVSAYANCTSDIKSVLNVFKTRYSAEPFVKVTTEPINLKQVVNTNYCLIQVEKYGNKVLVTSCIDNLLKGAAGQAIQNMNIRLGYPESTGLHLKSVAF